MSFLELNNVSKAFGDNKILDGLSFAVQEHSIFGFVGRNGAGKTTTMKMILGLLAPDSGDIWVQGERVVFGQNQTNRYIGYLPDVPEFYDYMTPMEYLILCGKVTGMSAGDIRQRADELLQMVGLGEVKKRIRGFSRGMKQRLGIAQALMNRPKLLICDEPTSALDPVGRKEILDILRLVRGETTVLFSTHILSDVERVCDEIAFLHQGNIVLSGSVDEVKRRRKAEGYEIDFFSAGDAGRFAQAFPGGCVDGNLGRFSDKSEQDMLCAMHFLAENEIAVQRMEMLEPTLEDLFLEVTRI